MSVEGVDPQAVTVWLEERVDAVTPPLDFSVVEGGRSNLTYKVSDQDGRSWVLRRPPLSGVLESAHDMNREHTIISALESSLVPVPRTIGYEGDDSVIGAEFYVMDFVEGPVLRNSSAARALDPEQRHRAADSLVDVLVALHDVDPDTVGLGDLGKKQDYIARQLHRWHGQFEKGSERDIPLIDDLHDRLAADIPGQQGATIVHGDYRLDNLIVDADTQDIRAVLDWELCTLGDPLADLGLLMVYWAEPGERVPLIDSPTVVEGFPSRDEIAGWYAERSGRDISELSYYVAFGYWKLAVILEGVYTRFADGAYEHQDEDVKKFGDVVHWLAERADEAARDVGR